MEESGEREKQEERAMCSFCCESRQPRKTTIMADAFPWVLLGKENKRKENGTWEAELNNGGRGKYGLVSTERSAGRTANLGEREKQLQKERRQ